MKSFLRKPSLCLQCLVMTLLLSFIGQAVALPDVCTMAHTHTATLSSIDVAIDGAVDVDRDMSEKSIPPCHRMNMAQNLPAPDDKQQTENQRTMDCCNSPDLLDGASMDGASCSCADDGCSASFPLPNKSLTGSPSFSEHRQYYSQPGFPSQVNSALFRPPIA